MHSFFAQHRLQDFPATAEPACYGSPVFRSSHTLRALLAREVPDMASVAAHLDGLSAERRNGEVLTLRRGEQAKLFARAEGFLPRTMESMVPRDTPPMGEVVHEGFNTLPTFRRFAKVLCRPPAVEAEDAERDASGNLAPAELWGYNRNRRHPLIETVVGPGYFVLTEHDRPGELLVDYHRVPPRKPDHWPPILPNSERLSRFVYHRTRDVLRGVSEHVTIGRARKGGRWLPAWFVLARQE